MWRSVILAVGDVVGHECILAASRMNNAFVLFLNSVEESKRSCGERSGDWRLFTLVLPLSTPAKKVTLSNVPPFITDEMFKQRTVTFWKDSQSYEKNHSRKQVRFN